MRENIFTPTSVQASVPTFAALSAKNSCTATQSAFQASGLNTGKHLTGLTRLASLLLATLLLVACGGGGGSSGSSGGSGGGPQVYQVSGATVVGGFRNVTINWLNPTVGSGNVTAVNITYQIVSVNGPANNKTTLLLNDNRHLLSDGTTVITETLEKFEPARYTFTIEPVLGGVLVNATTRAVAFPNVNVIVNPDDLDGDGVLNSVDVDADGDGLIEIYNATQLNMMRNNLAGTGLDADNSDGAVYAGGNSMGCGGGRNGDASACNGYEQMANIDLDDLNDVYPGEANWEPTGRCTGGISPCGSLRRQYFSAKFNGNDYTINNMRIIVIGDLIDIGFFAGTSAGSELRNIHIRNGSITISGNVFSVGGLVGGAIETRIISSSVTMSRVSGATIVGGLIGSDSGVTIVSSYAIVDELMAAVDIVGGLVGVRVTGTSNIISSVAIIGKVDVSILGVGGGLFGEGDNANINSSYAVVSNFRGGLPIGGLVGRSSGGVSINASYVVVNNSVADNGGLISSGTATAINSYWDNTTLTPSATASTIGMGLPTTALQSGTSTSAGTSDIFSEWNQGYCNPATGEFRDSAAAGFVLAWDLGTDTEYPALNCFSTFSPAQQRETAARALAGETLVE